MNCKAALWLQNSTSSGFETDLGNNVARVKGDADDLFSVRDSSGVNKFSVSTLDESLILNSNVTSSGSGSLTGGTA